MSRYVAFYQQMANEAAKMRNQDFRDGWNEAMEQVMLYDKPWTDPSGAQRAQSKALETASKREAECFDSVYNPALHTQKNLPPGPKKGLTYIAGPMSNVGPPTWNYPAFEAMATRLRRAGFEVISPHELHEPDSSVPWDWYLRADLGQLAKCTRVVFLPGWAKSRGATLEHTVAKALEMELVYPEDFEEWFRAR